MHALKGVTSLTALDLHDVGLRQRGATSLVVVLPTLQALKSLNISRIVTHCTHCTGLHSLDLWETLSVCLKGLCM